VIPNKNSILGSKKDVVIEKNKKGINNLFVFLMRNPTIPSYSLKKSPDKKK
jgi:hypothetical protein